MCTQSSVMSDSLWPHELQSPPGSCAHGIFQARILEWGAISSSRGSSWPRDWTHSLTLLQAGIWLIIIQNTNKKKLHKLKHYSHAHRMPMTLDKSTQGPWVSADSLTFRTKSRTPETVMRNRIYLERDRFDRYTFFPWLLKEVGNFACTHTHTHTHTHISTSNLALHSTFCNHKYRSRQDKL